MNQQGGFISNLKKQLLKQRFVYSIYNGLQARKIAKRISADKQVPQVDLKEQHIQNLKTLLNREDLLKHLPKNTTVAEIGVDRGEFSEMILEVTSPKKLHLIDAWEGGKYNRELKHLVEQKFSREIANGSIVLNVGLSTTILATMPDAYFDWVYLDTDHSYAITRQELNALKNKVKPGGIIAGHDYISYDFIGHNRYGVIEAVHKFCVNEHWEIIYLTAETNQYRSYAIRKISE
jgi:hypothetical protein